MEAGWSSWAGNQRVEQVEVVRPRGTDQIASVLTAAAAQGRGVRPIGSGHSFSAVGVPREVQLRLDRHDALVDLDVASGRVTVQAGMTLRRLNRLLEHAGLSLTNLGDIEAQTVAGAISTGTHGSGDRFGGLATQVVALRLVLPDGSTLAADDGDPALLDLLRVGLGALGVLDTVTLQAEPLFAVRAEERGTGLEALLDGYDELTAGTDHVDVHWFPHTRRVLLKRNTRVPLDGSLDALRPLSRARAWWDDDLLANTAFGAVVATGSRVPALVRPMAAVAARALGDRSYTDVPHRVLTSERRVRFVEMEYAVPREHLVPLVRELVAAVEASGWRIAVPVELRTAAADTVALSTAHGRSSGYVAVHVPPGSRDQGAFFATLERLAGQVGGRPHWGKLHGLDADALRQRYPRFDEVVALRDRLDPEGVLSNAHLDRVLGPVPARAVPPAGAPSAGAVP